MVLFIILADEIPATVAVDLPDGKEGEPHITITVGVRMTTTRC